MYSFDYFVKTGEIRWERDGIDDYDGDDGYDVTYNFTTDEVKEGLVDVLVDSSMFEDIELPKDKKRTLAERFVDLVDDADGLDGLVDLYYDELHDALEWRTED